MCGVEIAVVRHGMEISTVVAMDADWEIIFFFFFHLTKKTGLQVHPTTDMQFTESREEGKLNHVTHDAPQVFVSATVWQVLGGKRCVSGGWNWKAGRWMAEMGEYINIYLHICKCGKNESTFIKRTVVWAAGTFTPLFLFSETLAYLVTFQVNLQIGIVHSSWDKILKYHWCFVPFSLSFLLFSSVTLSLFVYLPSFNLPFLSFSLFRSY